jgi:cellulose synthase/poly-beta-1,6-N-acetylglucosamine synthase-like glycosyltransferase/spore germination protein YaaH/peptidoglycan/xylan/chitin deacetylase (PgdA/CDA1 family)
MVFEDPSRSRWRVVRLGLIIIGLMGVLLAGSMAVSLSTGPQLPKIAPLVVAGVGSRSTEPTTNTQITTTADAAEPAMNVDAPATTLPSFNGRFLRTAFLVQDDPASVEALRRDIHRLDAVFPDWYSFSASDGSIDKHIDITVAGLLNQAHVLVLPRISNTDLNGAWKGEAFADLIHDDDAVNRFAANLAGKLVAAHAQGVNLDIEDLQAEDQVPYLDWLSAVADACHKRNLYVTVDVPMNEEAYDYEAIGQTADAVVLMAYDEHYEGGPPGSVAGIQWFRDGVDDIAHRIPPGKLIVAMGGYGYDWTGGSKHASQDTTFADAMMLADEYGADIETDKETLNSRFTYQDNAGQPHEVWFLDAVSAWDQYLVCREYPIKGISLWRLGVEEPAVWDFLGSQSPDNFDPASLSVVQPLPDVAFTGDGELLKVNAVPARGRREMTFDGRSIDYASYEKLPEPYEVQRMGKADGKRVALTFDDGPHPTWTPRVMQVLADNNIHATFFLIGQNARLYPELVRAEVAQGHILGNHTFLHPNIAEIWNARLRLEVNATQRVIESITGCRTVLFRAPYDTDTSPTSAEQLVPLHTVTEMGYIIVGGDVDSQDYTKPGADQIAQNVLDGLRQTGSSIVVMHDGGGDRQQTVDALKIIIPKLREAGYQFVTAEELLGEPRHTAMPLMQTSDSALVTGDRLFIWSTKWGWDLLLFLFAVTTGLSILRIVFMGWFVLRRQRHSAPSIPFRPPVLVLIPAYNEEKVIGRTLQTVMASDYPCFRVLVVDDGSTDGTADVVREFAMDNPNIELRTKTNSGKASALNLGFRLAHEAYVVTLDADTIVGPQTIRRLIEPFIDDTVDAVCGNVQVGNVRSVLTAFQDVEYVTCQNYDRRAFESLNCISVVPGATGAWKRETVLRVGGYSRDTLTEDADLTLSVLKEGGRIVYATEARSITEAPEGARSLYRQRFRWSFGTFQCLWKHRANFGHGSLGWVAMPNMLLFQVIFPLLSPLGDLVLVLSILRGDFTPVAIGYTMFLAMDLIGSLIAFRLDRRRMGSMAVILIQRFYYRQFMYVVAIKALAASLRGRRHGWNKLERSASLSAANEDRFLLSPIAQPAVSPAH